MGVFFIVTPQYNHVFVAVLGHVLFFFVYKRSMHFYHFVNRILSWCVISTIK